MKRSLKNLAMVLYLAYAAGRDAVLVLLRRPRALVVCYHRIGPRDVLSKPPDEFEREIRYLSRKYRCVTVRDLHTILRYAPRRRFRVAAVTFDDGYRDNLTLALPALLRHRVPATFFVVTAYVGTARVFPHDQRRGQQFPMLNWDELRRMQMAGFEIGSHTAEHVDLGVCDAATTRRELRDSLARLDAELGRRPRAFAFPWGKPRNISRDALSAASEAGYYTIASACGGAARDPLHLRRVDVGNGQLSHLAVRARIAGFDPHLWQRMRDRIFRRQKEIHHDRSHQITARADVDHVDASAGQDAGRLAAGR